jgi:hypothetical protein
VALDKFVNLHSIRGPGSSVGIVTELRAGRSGARIPVGAKFFAKADRPWGPPSLLYNGYRVFLGGKVRPGRDADRSPPSRVEVLEELLYTSNPFWATTGPVTGLLHLLNSIQTLHFILFIDHIFFCFILIYKIEKRGVAAKVMWCQVLRKLDYIRQFSVWFFGHKANHRLRKVSSLQYRKVVSSFFDGNVWWLQVKPHNAAFSTDKKWGASQNLEYKGFFRLTLELSTGAQLRKLLSIIFGKEDIQSIIPTTVPAQSAPLSILADCRKRQILSTTPRYLPPIKRTNPTRNRHYHSRATVLPCDRQTSK